MMCLFLHPFHLSTYIFINVNIWVSLLAPSMWGTLCKCYTLGWTVAERGCSWHGFTNYLPLLPVNANVKTSKRDGVRIFFSFTWGRRAFWNCLWVWQWKIWLGIIVYSKVCHVERAYWGGEGLHSALWGLRLQCESSRLKTAKCTSRMTSPPSLCHTHLTD